MQTDLKEKFDMVRSALLSQSSSIEKALKQALEQETYDGFNQKILNPDVHKKETERDEKEFALVALDMAYKNPEKIQEYITTLGQKRGETHDQALRNHYAYAIKVYEEALQAAAPHFHERQEEVEDLRRLKAFYLRGGGGHGRAVTLNVFLEYEIDQGIPTRANTNIQRQGDLVKKALLAALDAPQKPFSIILKDLFLEEKNNTSSSSWRELYYDMNIPAPFHLLVKVAEKVENMQFNLGNRKLNPAEQASILEHLGIKTNKVKNPLPLSFLREQVLFTEAPSLLNLKDNEFLDSTHQSGDNRQDLQRRYEIKHKLIGKKIPGENSLKSEVLPNKKFTVFELLYGAFLPISTSSNVVFDSRRNKEFFKFISEDHFSAIADRFSVLKDHPFLRLIGETLKTGRGCIGGQNPWNRQYVFFNELLLFPELLFIDQSTTGRGLKTESLLYKHFLKKSGTGRIDEFLEGRFLLDKERVEVVLNEVSHGQVFEDTPYLRYFKDIFKKIGNSS